MEGYNGVAGRPEGAPFTQGSSAFGLSVTNASNSTPMASEGNDGAPAGMLDLLPLLSTGGITVSVGEYPILSIDSKEKLLDLEVAGAREAGLELSGLIRLEEGDVNLLAGSEAVARKLSRLGWKLTLYDEGGHLMALGSGVSRLTGHVSLNPMNLRRLRDALR
jgi:hypothetical protein